MISSNKRNFQPALKPLALAVMGVLSLQTAHAATTCTTTITASATISDPCSVDAPDTISYTGGSLTINAAISGTATPQITASGSITGSLRITTGGSVSDIRNTGSLDWFGIHDGSLTGTLTNTGTISTNVRAVYLDGGTSNTITNSSTGVIESTGSQAVYLFNNHALTTLENFGLLEGANGDILVATGSSITNFINAQGGADPVTYQGVAPSTYKTYIASTTDYGKLSVFDTNWDFNSITYGIAQNSTLMATTYEDVIQQSGTSAFTNTGDKTGTYFDGASNWNWTLTWDGSNFDLVVATAAVAPTSPVYDATQTLGNTPAGPAAQVIDGTPALQAYFTGTPEQISAAVSQTLPLLVGATPQVIFNTLGNTNRIVQTRLNTNRGMSSGDEGLMDKHAWVKVFGTRHDQDDRNGVRGYDGNSRGIVGGVDGDLNERTKLGLGFAFGNTDISGNAGFNSAEIDSYQLIGYGSYAVNDSTEVNFQADIGLSKTDGQRIMTAPVVGTAASNFDSLSFHLGTGIAKTFTLSQATQVTPQVSIDYTKVRTDGYTETGPAAINPFLNQVGKQTAEALEIGLGAAFSHQINDNTRFNADLGLAYDTINEQATITSSFVGGGGSFTTSGIQQDPWIKRAGLGLTHTTGNGTELIVRYDAESRRDFLDQSASLKLRWAF